MDVFTKSFHSGGSADVIPSAPPCEEWPPSLGGLAIAIVITPALPSNKLACKACAKAFSLLASSRLCLCCGYAYCAA